MWITYFRTSSGIEDRSVHLDFSAETAAIAGGLRDSSTEVFNTLSLKGNTQYGFRAKCDVLPPQFDDIS